MVRALLLQIDPRGVEELIDTSAVTAWDIAWAVLTLVGGALVARMVRAVTRRMLRQVTQVPEAAVNLMTKVAGWMVMLLAVMLALPFLGVDTGPIVIVILLLAAIAALSGRVLLENFGAGVILQSEAAFGPGDEIVTNDCVGRVTEVSSRSVKIDAIDGRILVVPNVAVLAGPLVNLTGRPGRRTELTVGLEYGTDLDVARDVLRTAAQSAEGVLVTPPVDVFVTRFGESSIDFLVWFWHASDVRSGHAVTDAVVRGIDRACRGHGLTIAFPQRTLWWGEGPPPVRP